jgi:Protein of unknown function (DUF964).
MEVIELAKKLGEALVASEEYKTFEQAKELCKETDAIRIKINQFNVQRELLDTESEKEEKDTMLIDALSAQVKLLYDEINSDPIMKEYNKAEEQFNLLIQAVNMTIASYLGTGEQHEHGASCSSGGCSSCSGCH